MRNIRYIYRLTVAFLRRFKIIIIVGILLGIILTYTFNRFAPKYLSKRSSRIGMAGRYTTENLPEEILNKISSGLTEIDSSYNVTPSLAESWETPDQGKTWIFSLRDNVTWHDNTELVSNDIHYNFDDVTVERPDDKKIKYILQDPFSPFPVVVSRPVFKRGLLGTSKWEVGELNISENTISNLLLIDKEGNEMNYFFYPTEQSTKTAYKLGEVDEIINLFDPSPFEEWNNSLVTEKIKRDQVVTLFFNTNDSLLSDKSVRQALNYGINKQELGKRRAISPISEDSWAYNPTVKPYDYDPERAKEFFQDIIEGGGEPSIKLVSAPALLPTAELIENDWEDIGINVNIQVSAIIPDEFQAFLAIFDLPEDPDQYPIWHSTQTDTNISGYTNPRIDKLLEDGRKELDINERKGIYLDFQRFLLEDSPAAFLYYPETYSVKRK